ncbi:MAG: DUF1449 family protein [Candidatus Wallbacteria bacterium]|nr:DUF1449 family protein [Candidatus Wallbacteria bacterium]
MNFLAWWNLIFELPIVAACLLSTVATLGADSHSGGDHDAEGDADAEIEAEGELDGHDVEAHVEAGDAELDHDIDHDAESDLEHEQAHEGHAAAGWLATALAIPGGDRAPLSIVMVVLLLAFGFIGLAANGFLARWMAPGAFVWISLVLATAGGLTASRGFARVFSRILPRAETYALGRDACVGLTAKVTTLMGPGDGYAQLYDAHRNLLEVRVQASEGSRFEMGAPIVLLSYDEAAGRYLAEPFDAEAVTGTRGSIEDKSMTRTVSGERVGRPAKRRRQPGERTGVK